MNAKELFNKAFALVKNKATWTQNWFAKNKHGHHCDVFDKAATCYCSMGALYKSVGYGGFGERRDLMEKVKKALETTASITSYHVLGIVGFNDGMPHEEVVKMWKDTGIREGWLPAE